MQDGVLVEIIYHQTNGAERIVFTLDLLYRMCGFTYNCQMKRWLKIIDDHR